MRDTFVLIARILLVTEVIHAKAPDHAGSNIFRATQGYRDERSKMKTCPYHKADGVFISIEGARSPVVLVNL